MNSINSIILDAAANSLFSEIDHGLPLISNYMSSRHQFRISHKHNDSFNKLLLREEYLKDILLQHVLSHNLSTLAFIDIINNPNTSVVAKITTGVRKGSIGYLTPNKGKLRDNIKIHMWYSHSTKYVSSGLLNPTKAIAGLKIQIRYTCDISWPKKNVVSPCNIKLIGTLPEKYYSIANQDIFLKSIKNITIGLITSGSNKIEIEDDQDAQETWVFSRKSRKGKDQYYGQDIINQDLHYNDLVMVCSKTGSNRGLKFGNIYNLTTTGAIKVLVNKPMTYNKNNHVKRKSPEEFIYVVDCRFIFLLGEQDLKTLMHTSLAF